MTPLTRALFVNSGGLRGAWQMGRASYFYSRMHDLGRIESLRGAVSLFFEYARR